MYIIRFNPDEDITHGVETMNLCEISVDVAKVGLDSWSLKTDEDAAAKMTGNKVFNDTSFIKRYLVMLPCRKKKTQCPTE